MKPDKRYVIIKSIPLIGGSVIPVNTLITRTHGMYYIEGGLMPESYQKDFDNLISHEEQNGWKYISPIREKEMFKVDNEIEKEDL